MKPMLRDAAAVASVFLLAACAQGGSPAHFMVMTNTIVITNSGATNLIGWRVLIAPDGSASWASGDGTGQSVLPPSLKKLAADIAASKPLANLTHPIDCIKPASFGTSTYISLGSDKSPDLTCPGNGAARALKDDVTAITDYLHVRNVPRGQGRELPPQNF